MKIVILAQFSVKTVFHSFPIPRINETEILVYNDPFFQIIFCISEYLSNRTQKTYWKGTFLLYSLTQLRIVFKDFFMGLVPRKDLVRVTGYPKEEHTFNFTVLERGGWGRIKVSDSTSLLKILQVLTRQFPATQLMMLLNQHLLRKAPDYIHQIKTSYLWLPSRFDLWMKFSLASAQ